MSNPIVVLKFGGSSVGEVRHWDTIVDQVSHHQRQGRSVILVLSALKNISNLLEALLHQAVAGVHPSAIAHLKEHHLGFAAQLGLSLEKELMPWFMQLKLDCEEIHRQKRITPKLHASVLSVGELLSSTIGCAYLKSRQVDCEFQDVREWLLADDQKQSDPWHHFTANRCDFSERLEYIKKIVAAPIVRVTQGFIARDNDKDTVLLGREGSDTSAAYLGAIMRAERIEIWTDVPGVFSFNPRSIAEARQIKSLSYQQAETLARSGAKVLHPSALRPAAKNQIPLWVKCTAMPDHRGTQILQQVEHATGPVAMAGETGLLRVQLVSGGAKELIAELLRLGFDIHQTLGEEQWLMRYVNSDVEQPSLADLAAHFPQHQLTLTDRLACICIVGQGENWKDKVAETMSQLNLLRPVNDEEHQQLFVVDQDEFHDYCQQLHHVLIEKHQDTNFGESWCCLMQS